jgi:hypothetical protein
MAAALQHSWQQQVQEEQHSQVQAQLSSIPAVWSVSLTCTPDRAQQLVLEHAQQEQQQQSQPQRHQI